MSRTVHLTASALPLGASNQQLLSSLRTPSDPYSSAQPRLPHSSPARPASLPSPLPTSSGSPSHSHRPSPSPYPAASAESATGPAHPSPPSGRNSSSRPETSCGSDRTATSSP